MQSCTCAARGAKWGSEKCDFCTAISESDLTHQLQLQEMFLPEDDFGRKGADTEGNRNRSGEEEIKERDKTAFC